MVPRTSEAYDLLHQGAIVLAEVESNGMCIDVEYIERTIKRTTRRVNRMVETLQTSEVGKLWKETFGSQMNFGSNEQLGTILFGKMGFTCPKKTKGGKFSTDEESISTVDHPFVSEYLEVKKVKKAVNENLRGILREVVEEKIHCFFNLHTVQTYRSSSEAFNFQNIPIRDPYISQLIRQAFIARPGRQLIEIDFSGAEVRVGACYHKDPVMIEYILDPAKDMHRDMAMECFQLPQSEITKPIRHCGKNQFVFPEFYGDWYKDCAKIMWKSVDKIPLVTTSGKSVREHLNSLGMGQLGDLESKEGPAPGTFADRIRQVEAKFWGERFRVYDQWKKNWFEEYRHKGWFETLTGFVCQGYMERNQVVNYPVQGSAFHCLLWSLIRIQNEIHRRGMKTMICGQIHDSMVCDVVPEERDEFIEMCHQTIRTRLPRRWEWLIVPMEAEVEASPVGGTWADKKKWSLH